MDSASNDYLVMVSIDKLEIRLPVFGKSEVSMLAEDARSSTAAAFARNADVVSEYPRVDEAVGLLGIAPFVDEHKDAIFSKLEEIYQKPAEDHGREAVGESARP